MVVRCWIIFPPFLPTFFLHLWNATNNNKKNNLKRLKSEERQCCNITYGVCSDWRIWFKNSKLNTNTNVNEWLFKNGLASLYWPNNWKCFSWHCLVIIISHNRTTAFQMSFWHTNKRIRNNERRMNRFLFLAYFFSHSDLSPLTRRKLCSHCSMHDEPVPR